MKQLFLASSNRHKLRELSEILKQSQTDWQVLSLLDHPEWEQKVAETGTTYQENAYLKAEAYVKIAQMPVLADDSGVDVLALPRLLGVKSARWHSGDDQERTQALLDKLENQTDRTLIYHCVLCWLTPQGQKHYFTGELKGQAAKQPRGSQNFGYDPIFIPDGYQKTLGELGPEIKNQISHRHQALEKLLKFLTT